MKHLTQSEYQSLLVNEQSNWKEQWQYEVIGFDDWYNCDLNLFNINFYKKNIDYKTRQIYIPINPESVLNAEIREPEKENPLYVEARLWSNKQTGFIGDKAIGYINGAEIRTQKIIDIVEAEIKYFKSAKCFESAGVLTDLLTKLKEIK